MSIKFKWVDRNVLVDGFRVYRSTTPIDDAALPTPLATVASNVFEYTDITAVRNVVYYYKVGAFLGGLETLSPNRPLAFMPYTGPGPQKLIRGDYKAGFFGELLLEEIIGIADFKTLYGVSGTNGSATKWLKFVSNGKILFLADGCFFVSLTAQAVYQAGLLYGTNDAAIVAPMKNQFGVADQVRPLTKGEHVFIPRSPVSRADRTGYGSTTATARGGEVDTCFATMYMNRSFLAEYPTVMGDYVNEAVSFFTGDSATATTLIARGSSSFDSTGSVGNTANATWGYRPVLELVP